MSEQTEREDLEQLVMCPGWLRFAQYVRKSWGPEGYGLRIKRAVTEAKAAGQDQSDAVARVDAANDAVNEVLSWPTERARALLAQETQRRHEREPTLSRRGTL